MNAYDILWVGDLRFPGGTGTAIAEEIAASVAAGYRCGLIFIRSPILGFPHPINPRIRRFVDQGDIDLLDHRQHVSCRLCCLYHPQSFTHFPIDPPRIDAEIKLLVTTHPPYEGDGQLVYDSVVIDRHAQELLGGDVLWAPVGPAVRRQLGQLASPPNLIDQDWCGVINHADWQSERSTPCGTSPVIGRHSRPDPAKWPDTRDDVLTVYPASSNVQVKILGDGPFLRQLVDPIPANWQVFAFNQITPRDFLKQLGIFVYFHHSRWVEAFGYAVLEALAARLPVVLPFHFEPLFEDAAIYVDPHQVRDKVEDLYSNHCYYNEQTQRAGEMVEQRFSHQTYKERIQALIGPPSKPVKIETKRKAKDFPIGNVGRGRRRAMFISSNGIGMGHLTRLLAIARRLPATIDPIFLTMSRAARYVQDFGYPVEYLPFHAALGCDVRLWNHHLRRDLSERFAFYQPDVVIFDGNVPYDGLISAMASVPTTPLVWCRRAMWTKGAGREFIWRERFADIVIEPAEIAGELDRGLTTEHLGKTRVVDPILLFDPVDGLRRMEARAELDLDDERPACLIQLGANNNFNIAPLRLAMLEILLQHPDLQIVWLDWTIAENQIELPPSTKRLSTYPIARHLNAFDFAISSAGYNAYHELLANGVPTLFVPNENPMMDDQLARAFHADLHGLGLMIRRCDHYRISETLERLLDHEEQATIRERCRRLTFSNGAKDAARIVDELAYTCRADLDPADDIISSWRRIGG